MSSLASPTWHALAPRARTAAAARPRFGAGIPPCDWPTRGPAGVAWSALLLDGHNALEALHELCDALFGVSAVPQWGCTDAATLRARLTPGAVVEATRRLCLFFDSPRAGVGRATAAQVAAIGASIVEDAASEAAAWVPHADGDGVDVLAAALRDAPFAHALVRALLHAAREDGAVPAPAAADAVGMDAGLPFARDMTGVPLETRVQALPSWMVAGGTVGAMGTRLLAAALGFVPTPVRTRHGSWLIYVLALAPSTPAAAACSTAPPLLLVHGMFTTSASMLPLAALIGAGVAAAAGACAAGEPPYRPAALLVPDLLDFDFGYSRSGRGRPGSGQCDGGAGGLVGAGGGSRGDGTAEGHNAVPSGDPARQHRRRPLLPDVLSFDDHVEALAELVDTLVGGGGGGRGAVSTCNPAGHPHVDALGHSFGGYAVTRVAASPPDAAGLADAAAADAMTGAAANAACAGGASATSVADVTASAAASATTGGGGGSGGNPRVRRIVLLCPGGYGRYRVVASSAPLAGARAVAAVLAGAPADAGGVRGGRGQPPRRSAADAAAAAALATAGGVVFTRIARSPFTSHTLGSMDTKAFFAPPRVRRAGPHGAAEPPQPALLLWGRADKLHRPWRHRPDAAMLEGLPAGLGYWLEGGDHGINVDAVAAVATLTARFLALSAEAVAAAASAGALPPCPVPARGDARPPPRDPLALRVPLALRACGPLLWAGARAAGADRTATPMRRGGGRAAGSSRPRL